MWKLLFSLGVIAFGLSTGYLIQSFVQKEFVRLPMDISELRKLFQRIALLFFNPVSFLGAIWIIRIDHIKIATLPFIGALALILGGLLAFGASRLLKLNRKQTGSFIICGSFTNVGSIGGLVCYVFLGEIGFAFMPIYKLFEEVIYYGIGFPIAKFFSTEFREEVSITYRLRTILTDIFVLVAIISISIGILLNISGIKRPEIYKTINAVFIPVGSIFLLSSIGMAMKFKNVSQYINESIVICLIKYMLVPASVTFTAFFLGFGAIHEGLPLKVVIVLSSMPVAFTALVPPSIYNLDIDLANSCWLVTTALLFFVLPVLNFVVHLV
jgi:hypothetical protein